jgi:type II secretion system protein G
MNMHKSTQDQRGFTLIEIVIAVAILALLATTVAPMVLKHMEDAKVTKMIQTVKALEMACIEYHMDTAQYAREYTGYTEATNHGLAMDPGYNGWDGPYLDKILSKSQNPWGGTIHLYASLNSHTGNGYDMFGSGSVTHNGAGNSLIVWNVKEKDAERVDLKMDGDLPGDWKTSGRIEYQNNRLCIYIHQ